MFHPRVLLSCSALILLALWLMSCGSSSAELPVTTVALQSDGSTCSPSKIETRQGYLLKLSLKNTGVTPVAFVFPDAPYTFTAQPGETALGNFTAPTAIGNYKFQCGLAGQSGEGTVGEIQVRSS